MKLHPFDETARAASEIAEKGGVVYQQFNCEKCGTKQTMGEPNIFFTTGQCEECKHITNIRKNGCNYMVHWRFS